MKFSASHYYLFTNKNLLVYSEVINLNLTEVHLKMWCANFRVSLSLISDSRIKCIHISSSGFQCITWINKWISMDNTRLNAWITSNSFLIRINLSTSRNLYRNINYAEKSNDFRYKFVIINNYTSNLMPMPMLPKHMNYDFIRPKRYGQKQPIKRNNNKIARNRKNRQMSTI